MVDFKSEYVAAYRALMGQDAKCVIRPVGFKWHVSFDGGWVGGWTACKAEIVKETLRLKEKLKAKLDGIK